jgi:DNA-binding CsgD family transcriptional regulator
VTTDIHDPIRALLTDPVGDVSEYAGRALRSLRAIADPDVWTQVYEQGLREAYRQGDMEGLASVVAIAVFRSDAVGRLDQAVSHIDFALAMADGMPDAVALLESVKAPYLMIQGDFGGATKALRAARRALKSADSPRSRNEYIADSAVAAAMALDTDELPVVRKAVGILEQAGDHRLAVFVMSWLVPLMFAVGERTEAQPWIEALRVHTQDLPHPYRNADADSFEFASSPAWETSEIDSPYRAAIRSGNWLATYRLAALELRQAVIREDAERSERAVGFIERLSGHFGGGSTAALANYRAFVSAWRVTDERAPSLDPPRPTLVNLGGLLSAAEAVAIAGTQRDAVKWLNWIERTVSPEVRTSLEWPVARDRVLGLLRVRAGSVREAVRAFRDAIDWASRAGYTTEAALSQVQLAEVLSLSQIASSERARQRLRKAGWVRLQEMNIDPTPHAYAATRALALREDLASRPQLTPRQVEVLSLLAEGMTYRQAAAELGTSWRTVSTQAYQAYDRLGVSGKHEAVKMARRLQIL